MRAFSKTPEDASKTDANEVGQTPQAAATKDVNEIKKFGDVMAGRWRAIETSQRPSNRKLMRPTCYYERRKVENIQEVYIYKGPRTFEIDLHSCPEPFRWRIHGGRTGYQNWAYNSRSKRQVLTITNYVAPTDRRQE